MASNITIPVDYEIDPENPEESVRKYAEYMRSLIKMSTNVDVMATALRRRIINQLRAEGIDSAGGFRGVILGSDAVRTAGQIIAPLRAAAGEAEQISKAGVLFERRFTTLFIQPIQEARRQQTKGTTQGLKVR